MIVSISITGNFQNKLPNINVLTTLLFDSYRVANVRIYGPG